MRSLSASSIVASTNLGNSFRMSLLRDEVTVTPAIFVTDRQPKFHVIFARRELPERMFDFNVYFFLIHFYIF